MQIFGSWRCACYSKNDPADGGQRSRGDFLKRFPQKVERMLDLCVVAGQRFRGVKRFPEEQNRIQVSMRQPSLIVAPAAEHPILQYLLFLI